MIKIANQKQILLVEDEVIIAMMEKKELAQKGYSVHHVCNGEDAVKSVLDLNSFFDLILMDIDLGSGIDGTQAAEQILKQKEIPIIFLSSHIEPEVVEKTEKITFYGYVLKNSKIIVLDAAIKMAFKLFDAKLHEKEHCEALKNSEAKFSAVYNQMHCLGGILDTNGVLLDVNPAAINLIGDEDKFCIGKPFWETQWWSHSVEDQKRLSEDIPRAASGCTIQFDTVHLDISGNIHNIEFKLIPIKDKSGKVIYIFAEGRDITGRIQMEEALKISEHKYKSIFENVQDVYYFTDLEEKIIEISPSIEKITGFTRNELLGKSILELYNNPVDRKVFLNLIMVAVEVNDYEVELKAKDGRLLNISTSSHLIISGGKPIGIEGFFRDITKRRQAEEKIKQQLLEKEILLKEVHHRIKNNIASIEGMLALQIESITDEESKSILVDAIGRIQNMRIIYNKLLLTSDYKEIASKRYFEDLISSIINLFPGMNGVTVKNEIDDFNIDQKILFPLGLIINELITNSMKYAFPDKYPGRIGIMMQKKENEITLTVQDNGIGLPVNFDINKSNSFGLMLVRMLSQQLKGSFFIENNKGTKCILVFKI